MRSSARSSETRGVGEVEEVAPVAQRHRRRRGGHAVPARSKRSSCTAARMTFRIRSVELHFQVRVGHDSWREPHVLVGLLTGIGRELPRLAEEHRRRGAIPGFCVPGAGAGRVRALLPNPRERSR